MGIVWLVRHGEARKAAGQSPDDLFSVERDPPLSARGIAQAEAARDALTKERIGAVHASPTRRARETAAILGAPHALDVRIDARLAELHVGGAGYADVLEGILDLPERFEKDPSTFADERRALEDAIREAAASHEGAIVVAHALSIRAFLAMQRGIPMGELLTIPMEHAQVTRLDL